MDTTAVVGIIAFVLVVWLAPSERRTGSVFFKPAVVLGTGIIVAAFILAS